MLDVIARDAHTIIANGRMNNQKRGSRLVPNQKELVMKRTHKVIIMKRCDSGYTMESEPLFVTATSKSHAMEIAREYLRVWDCYNEYAHHAVKL